MNTRKYVTDPQVLLAQGKALIKANNDAVFQHRVEMVNLILAGITPSALSELVGESKNTLTSWVKTADEKGFDALRPSENKGGRPTKITDNMAVEIDLALQNDANMYGYDVWDGISLADYIKKTFAIEYSVRQCQRLFRDLGYNLKRPQTFPCKDENDPRREEFKKKYRHAGS